MFKKLLVVLVVICVVFSGLTIPVSAASNGITVLVDEKPVVFSDAQPFIDGQSIVQCPMKPVAEALGVKVEIARGNKSVIMKRGINTFKFTVGKNTVAVNGKNQSLKTKTLLYKNTIYVPLQFISKILGEVADWDSKTGTVKIIRTQQNAGFPKQSKLSKEETKIKGNLTTYLDALAKNKNFHGSVLVAKNGKILLDQGYGMADLEQGIQNLPQTRFAIGSVTKQFTAMAIMQLSEKGLLNVQDKLTKYIPDFPRGDEITLQNLLTHSSGLVEYTALAEFLTQSIKDMNMEEFIKIIESKPLEFNPGEKWAYCNSGYLLLGYIVEKVSGESYEQYVSEHIFKPIGMKNSGICYTDTQKMYTAKGYIGYMDLIPIDDEYLLTRAFGAGCLFSTVEDLYLWDRALYGEKVVSKKTLDEIFMPRKDTKALGYYGYGWFITNTASGKEVFHGGNTSGFTAEIARYVDKNLTFIVLTNNYGYDIYGMDRNINLILSGKKVETPIAHKAIKVSSKIFDSYVGVYELAPGTNVTITKEKDILYTQIPGLGKCSLIPESNTKFFSRDYDLGITFKKNSKGEVNALVLNISGKDNNAVKISNKPVVKKEASVDLKVYDTLVGDYEIATGFIITVTKEDNKLYAQATGQGKFEILPESETEYFFQPAEIRITFVKDADGIVTSLVLHQGGGEYKAPKVK